MLAGHFIDPDLKVKKGDNKIRAHRFCNSGLKYLLHLLGTQENFKQTSSAFFCNKKE